MQLTPLSTHWAPRKKNKKRVQSFSDTVYMKTCRCIVDYCAHYSQPGETVPCIKRSRLLPCHLQWDCPSTIWCIFCCLRFFIYIYRWYVVSSWKQTGALNWKWSSVLVISMFVTVLAAPVSHAHRNCCSPVNISEEPSCLPGNVSPHQASYR